MSEKEDQDLRDIFAALTMHAIVAQAYNKQTGIICNPEFLSEQAYDMADWMLDQRKAK